MPKPTLPEPTSPRRQPALSRRTVVQGAGALAVASVGGPLLAADSPADALGPRFRTLVTDWLAQLDERQRDAALFSFDSRTRRRWTYMLGSAFANGLALEQMTPSQKDGAMAVLDAALSSYGLETAENIMLQQDILRDEWGKGSADRNRERFSLQVYGAPSATGPWAWRWEGHHVTITFTMMDDQVISQTPKAFSSEPNTVPSGPHSGLVVLPENETLGRALFADLGPEARRAALIREDSFGNILAGPGREDAIGERRGVPLADLPESQADIVRRLVALYTSDHLAAPLAEGQQARIAAEDEGAIRFGWAGDNRPERSIYYRIHGATFLIEFATLRRQPQHHHTIVHDLERNFGDHRLA
ncbi:MAG: DUF3500 domain-containing protein [Pseudomonadota bacterium]